MANPQSLAVAYQEMFTVIVRIRSNRQVARNAAVFRANMRGVLKKAEQDAIAYGYGNDNVRIASFAVVAFLDESILSSGDAVFGDWNRMPLQQEVFRTGNAGEEFYKWLKQLLTKEDSSQLADLLEVFYLCLLLGFRGRYTGAESLSVIKGNLAERIRRIRGPAQPLCVSWALPPGPSLSIRSNAPVRWLAVGSLACLLLALALFFGFRLSLNSGLLPIGAGVFTLRQ